MGDVHRDFHAEAKIDRLRGFPLHDEVLRSFAVIAGPGGPATPSSPKAGDAGKRIIMNRSS
jgi:hypothetical protein